ncbi:UDP-N-acetylmuramate dehydrogenase [Modicisalibacter ilicicola DSM 19980]|uniref:UDP-N-acetylenolpyruvoylglucosamine reductase n=1 Tax=Modicisalibacter ilicicola DSM 19980 TaxID=1121942 RepID=A0A1M5CBU8_9GAMM|nr:UDP-N-acetylmuramate dehydrogenase [Halomonas ilicicola]SHF52195.1 UDP-N-acetylmuramate dehydrogenase [Halomonas ilicicola DSM 19980]
MIRRDVELASANTLGLPCRAERFLATDDVATIRDALRQAVVRDWPLTVLGGGSNLVVQPWLPGLTLQPTFADLRLEEAGQGDVLVHAGAGLNWHALVEALAERNLWGIENLALIPGHVGAAPIQNIGAYGVELADVFERVHLLHLEDGREAILGRQECAFGYRDSVFKHALENRVVITRLVLRVSRRARPRLDYGDLARRLGATPTAREVVAAVSAVRREKLPDPAVLGNAGSFFKNPVVSAERARALLERHPQMPHFPLDDGGVKLAAGWLIDQCGLKGLREGQVGVHDRQALVLVHHGGGSAAELLALARRVVDTVQARFGVVLEQEPRLMGRMTR